MTTNLALFALALALSPIEAIRAQPPVGNAAPVTVDNFIRAESDFYISILDGSWTFPQPQPVP